MSLVSGLIGGITGSAGAKKAAVAASQYNQGQIADTRQRNDALLQPFVGGGQAANANILALLGLGGDPAAAQKAFSDYENSTGAQFRFGRGVDAVDQSAVNRGALNSGSTLKGLTQFGQNFGTGEFNNYLGQIGQQQQLGFNAAGQNIESNNNLLAMLTGNANNAASDIGNASLVNGKFGVDLLKSLFQGGGQQAGASSYGASAGGGFNPASLAALFAAG